MMRIEFEHTGEPFTAWLVNRAGYVVSTEPANHHLFVGCRITDPLKKINEGSLLTIEKNGQKTKVKYRVTEIRYLD